MVKPRFSAQGEIRLQQFLRGYQMPRFLQIDKYWPWVAKSAQGDYENLRKRYSFSPVFAKIPAASLLYKLIQIDYELTNLRRATMNICAEPCSVAQVSARLSAQGDIRLRVFLWKFLMLEFVQID